MTILDKILKQKKLEVRELKAIYSGHKTESSKKRVSLYNHFIHTENMSVIAEVKRASPSKGIINPDVDPVAQAKAYVTAGAGAISVLTDRQFFKGSMADLSAVAQAVDVPLLCKDFIIDEVQIDAAKDHGASIILLIAAALPETRLKELYKYAQSQQLDILFEVHNEEEAETALNIGANIIGINNRNLKTFEVDLAVTERVASLLQQTDCLFISESGIKTKEDVERVREAGAKGILVGETLMRSSNIQETMSEIRIPFSKVVE
ncbi:indole-3-glycerol phosphate synthase TrpC [Lederbergia sp. NSJ-179]|uniref:indole-3-glycerol phosphate synthase TrpC n=1 Tax=Lederbergia sp. NSJ-179 TaxID=2931402 RepID=UPI001FD3A4D9|nr:indole-3-glycerol phosphate synthase TrpC [Lederbergia sp. NSJ-179]MCJ7842172.1 indole-3-glycerol phosphate synthase TrpC [Lederbergia sp. NSJ-179]